MKKPVSGPSPSSQKTARPVKKPVQRPVTASGRPVSWIPWTIIAVSVLGIVAERRGWLEPVQDFLDRPEFIFRLGRYDFNTYFVLETTLAVLFIAAMTVLSARLIKRRIERARSLHPSAKPALTLICVYGLYALAVVFTVYALEFELGFLSFLQWAAGIAIGLAVYKPLANIVAAPVLMFSRKIRSGQCISTEELPDAVIESVGVFSTVVSSGYAKIALPNTRLLNSSTLTANEFLEIPISVSNTVAPRFAADILKNAVQGHPGLSNTAVECLLEIRSGAFDFRLLIPRSENTADEHVLRSTLNILIAESCHQSGITLA